MPATYEPIATTTLGSAASSITFSSIPATYTDLRLVFVGTYSLVGDYIKMQFNSDTATNYSTTSLYGTGAVAASSRLTSRSFLSVADNNGVGGSLTIPTFFQTDLFSYAGSTNKTLLWNTSNDQNGSGTTHFGVGLWRNTAAITTILMTASSGNFNTGTTATLYGIKNF